MEYLRSAPKHIFRSRLLFAISLIIILVIVAGVFLYCVYMGKQEIAMRILEIVTTAIISLGGGYAWGKSRKTNENETHLN
ncbi:hypothetical protein [Chitinophaga flava]|uniref:hypothetical protein n=1 Tax=Chitinophaga flava TaxID=2259036 RepID=UPI0011BE1D9D|nr:hypothetical protein [Chitinophaga flava]